MAMIVPGSIFVDTAMPEGIIRSDFHIHGLNYLQRKDHSPRFAMSGGTGQNTRDSGRGRRPGRIPTHLHPFFFTLTLTEILRAWNSGLLSG
jgi:hypothetical protein